MEEAGYVPIEGASVPIVGDFFHVRTILFQPPKLNVGPAEREGLTHSLG